MRRAGVERALGGVLDVSGRVEIGLADLEVNDLAPLALQRLRARQHLERRLRPEPAHPFRHVHARLLAG